MEAAMTEYVNRVDLERMEPYLRNNGFASSLLTVRDGVQQLEIYLPTGVVIVDQFGNVDDGADQDITALEAAIATYING
jgi:hypothetical protein